MSNTDIKEITRKRLIDHFEKYPKMQIADLFKYLYQSSFGCEHLVSSQETAAKYIEHEYKCLTAKDNGTRIDELDGEYSRVHLYWLNDGITASTLSNLFCKSAKHEADGEEKLIQKLDVVRELVENAVLPFDQFEFKNLLKEWKEQGYPAIHHSEAFRAEYCPAYRVILNEYVRYLPIFSKIDNLLSKGRAVIAIEGGSAGGKSTLAELLKTVYTNNSCNVFHVDDFFLRPEQRTPERFSEIGGNFDRERFLSEIINPIVSNNTVRFRPFDCSTWALGEEVVVAPADLTVIEGVYSMHPSLGKYYDFSVFMNIDPECQKERVLKRNGEVMAKRFFEEWIPLENIYFEKMNIKDSCNFVLDIKDIER